MNYGYIYYYMIFVKVDQKSKMKADKVRVSVMNHQVTVYYGDQCRKAVVHRIIDVSEEHETLSLMSYYQGMGYKLVEYERKRITLLTERERLERLDKLKKGGEW